MWLQKKHWAWCTNQTRLPQQILLSKLELIKQEQQGQKNVNNKTKKITV